MNFLVWFSGTFTSFVSCRRSSRFLWLLSDLLSFNNGSSNVRWSWQASQGCVPQGFSHRPCEARRIYEVKVRCWVHVRRNHQYGDWQSWRQLRCQVQVPSTRYGYFLLPVSLLELNMMYLLSAVCFEALPPKKKRIVSTMFVTCLFWGITFTEKWNTDNIVTVEVAADDAVGKGSKLSAVGTFSPFTGWVKFAKVVLKIVENTGSYQQCVILLPGHGTSSAKGDTSTRTPQWTLKLTSSTGHF